MGYHIKIEPSFKRELKKLSRQIQKKIIDRLDEMQGNPRPANVEKLSQDFRFWRMRIDDYRMIYAINDSEKIVIACRVRHRRDAYRDIDILSIDR